MLVTYKYGVWVVVSGLVLAIVTSPTSGQFEDLQGCVSNCRFIPLLTGCLAEKFLIMLNLPPLSTECPSATNGATFDSQGDYPTHHAGVKVASTTLRSGYLDDVALRHAQKKQQSTLSDQTFHFIENLLSKTSSVQTDTPLLDTYLRSRSIPSLESILIETIEPLRGEAGRFKNTLIQAQAAMMALSSEEIQKGSASPQRSLVTSLQELQRIVSCLREGYEEKDYEDGLTWTKCLFTCSDLPLIGPCMADAFAQIGECNRTLWLKDLIIRVLTDFLDLEDCYFKIQSPSAENLPLTLEEGDEPTTVKFITYQPPGVYCWPANPLSDLGGVARGVISNVFKLNPPCSVEIQLTTSNYMYDTLPYVRTELLPGIDMGRPKCRNGSAINQVAIGWHPAAGASSGIIQLSEQNWNQTFQIPLSAVIDYKMEDDAYLNVSFTMKMVVDNNIFNTTKIEMNVFDNDPVNISTCTSFNDPHIVTFDGSYYNNFYHGYFQMYKHSSLPYEVQVAYQACDGKTNESCTCAVAVRSGDDVFVVDRCRQRDCASPDCTVVQKITLYQNKELTPGTDIYKLDGGLSYMVSLPHGTLVKIVNNREMLNVYITPSPFDRRNTLGLCGTFNEHREDDFTLSDGATIADSVTTFVESWRLNFNETIFDGALENETQYNNGNFCQCAHYLIGYAQCNCGYSTLRQTCDLDLDNKFSAENITSIVRRSEKQSLVESEDTRDMDINYVPNLPSWADNTIWPEQRSFDYCITNTHMKGKNLIQECKDPKTNNEFLAPVKNAFQGCMDDIAILDEASEVWKLSFLEMMKYGCLERVYRASGREARNWMKYVNETCINDCSQAGVCVYGVCQCNGDMAGPDCSISASQPPQVIMTATSLCDTRYQNCSYSTVYGQYFTDDKRITCRATPKQVISTERLPSTKTVDVGIVLLSNDQIACVLPRSGSFSVQVLWQDNPVVMQSSSEVRATGPFLFKSYDSACYVCPPGQEMCSEKKDWTYCLIGNTCYASLQPNPSNDCQICNLTYSQSSFYYMTDQRCTERRQQEEKAKADEKRDKDIRIGVSVGLSCLVVLITIIMLMCSRRSDDNKSDTISSHSSTISSTNNISKQFNGMTPDEIAPPLEQKAKEAAVSSSIPTINISDDSGTQSLKLRDSNQSSASDTHDHVDGSNDSSAQSINSTAALVSGPGNNVISTTAEVTDVKLEQKLEANGKPVHPRVLLIGEDNFQYGSMKSLSKVAMVRERKDSLSSVKSVGIGGGPPIQYGLNRHSFNSSGVNVSNVKL